MARHTKRQQEPAARDSRRERLAVVAHDHCSEWVEDLLAQTVTDQSGEVVIPAAVLSACQARLATPYADLSPADKDRVGRAADAFLAILDDAEPSAEKGTHAPT